VNTTKTRRMSMLAGFVALSLATAACGSDTKTDAAPAATNADAPAPAPTEAPAAEPTEAPAAEPADTPAAPASDAAGEVFVTGSSTVEPISIKVGEFVGEQTGGAVAVTVEGPGTGDGFKKFCAGEGDITDASRPIKDEEAALCTEAGIEYTEIEVAIDGLTVATSPANSAVECLDIPALYALLGPESEGFAKWSDANALATELESKYVPLPDADLVISGPGEESGTYDSFVEFAIKKIAEGRTKDVVLRADYAASPNDNVIVEGIEGSDTSLGWVGYAYYIGEKDRMKAIAIEGKDGTCVTPDDASIADGSYPFSRTLYIYVNKASAASNPGVVAFVDAYVTEGITTLAAEAGYVALPADRATAAADAWAAAQG
jgi:phosphate transport system substrate-binding protein